MEQSTRLTLEAAAIALIGVIVTIGLTVGFGLRTDSWIGVIAGAGASVLVVVVELSSSEGAALRRAANWITRVGPRALSASGS